MKTGVVALAAAAIGLLGVLAAEWMPGEAPVVVVAAPSLHARGAAASEPDSAAKDTEAWARTIVARPLFAMARRPPKSIGGHNPVAATGLPRLSGIMISPGGRRAIFMPEGGKARTLAEGATLEEYTIRQIAADHVVMSGAKGDMVLHPVYDGSLVRTGGPGDGAPPGFGQPGMGQPGFQPAQFNPAFRPQGFQPTPPQPAANASDDDNSDDATPTPTPVPQQFPGFHGPIVPRGRNNE